MELVFIIGLIYIILSIYIEQYVHNRSLLLIKKYLGCSMNSICDGKAKEYACLEIISVYDRVEYDDKKECEKLMMIERVHNISFSVLIICCFVYAFFMIIKTNLAAGFLFIFFSGILFYIIICIFNNTIRNEKRKIETSLAKDAGHIIGAEDNKTDSGKIVLKISIITIYVLSSIVVLCLLICI